MNKFSNLTIILLTTFSFIVGCEKNNTRSDILPRIAAMTTLSKALEEPVQDADGTYNLLCEKHFQTLTQAILKQQTGDPALPASFTFKVGDTIRTKKLTVLLPGDNREYRIVGDKITCLPDPNNPRYQLYKLSAGNILLVGCQAECQPNAHGRQVLVCKKTEEYLLTLSK